MAIFSQIQTGLYYDSITLMNLQKKISQIVGIKNAAVAMATPVNKTILKQANLWQDTLESATADDLVVSIEAETESIARSAWEEGIESLKKSKASSQSEQYRPKSLSTAIRSLPQANLALISVPGKYAAHEAKKCLENGLNVMIFSDNVTLEEEVSLKKSAVEKNLLVMGPDCGTAIISGVGLGFANAVRLGGIGIVGASGTGTQEICSLVHSYGQGISHAIGTGGRDLSVEVGGITMLQGLQALQDDSKTQVIVIVSKPPHPSIQEKIIQFVEQKATKPVIIHFLGKDSLASNNSKKIYFAENLEHAARLAVEVLTGQTYTTSGKILPENWMERIQSHRQKRQPQQKYLRGLYSGGTLAYETMFTLGKKQYTLYSNLTKDKSLRLDNPSKSFQHSIIDLGEDEYTVGRPHPMIDNTFRSQRLLQEIHDPETDTIILDIVCGYGSQIHPLDTLLPIIQQGQSTGRDILFIVYICGTDTDPQGKENIQKQLLQNGVILPYSNAQTAEVIAQIF